MTKEQAKAIVEKLVNRYTEQQKSYHAADYNETKTRRDFIDPFFKALGWDMDNEQDVAEPYREVIHEDKIKIQGKTKSPDYGFRLQGAKQQLFFVEAKKPSVSLKTNKESSFQIRRYGWNSKVSVSILTNFEDFIVYDCSKKPNINDSASVARLKTISYDQYIQEFDFIYDTFSREAIVKGRFDSYVKSDTAKKGTQTLDKEFVASLDTWRQYLATDLAKSNLKLNEDELNFAVQLIIDRLIFLRFCEDRGVETYGQLKAATSKGNAYENLHVVFQAADDKYNSGLFDFEKDKITNNLKVTNKVIKNIVEELYYPLSQYDFKALPVEVLGNAYEQFLGKVIRIDKGHHAVIEEKPEVRKAGGVFYTPQYIVDYIVENTVGKLIAGKTPKEIEKIKIVDPACGSGSFLLGAFDYLLKYHIDYYYKNPPSAKSGIITPNGTLSTAEKKKIILNNIFGVDLDANAVEVSKLSLLLKCMEGETEASIKQQITMFHERVLPDLDNNIKDGNSLIDTDIYDTEIDLGFERKIKPFSWQKAFPTVFNRNVVEDKSLPYKAQYNRVKNLDSDTNDLINNLSVSEPQSIYSKKNGGFDIVIGNPPYVKVADSIMFDYFQKKYTHQDYQQDLYLLFLERYHHLLVKGGMLGVIIPNTWLQSIKFRNIRKYLVTNYYWDKILHNDEYVFKAVVDTHVLLFQKNNYIKNYETVIDISKNKLITKYQIFNQYTLPENGDVINIMSKEIDKNLFEKIKSKSVFIKDICFSTVGVKPFQVGKGIPKQTQKIVDEKPFVKENTGKPKGKFWMPLLRGSLINRYVNYWENNSWIEYGEWLAEPRKSDVFYTVEKIIIRQTGDSIIATIIGKDIICRNNLHIVVSEKINHKLLLGIINSKLTNFYYYQINPEKGEALAEVKKNHVEQLPIPIFTPNNIEFQAEIIKHVSLLLKLNEDLKTEKLQTKIDQIKQRIEHSEDKINQLVYDLYELTAEEIKIVEESVK